MVQMFRHVAVNDGIMALYRGVGLRKANGSDTSKLVHRYPQRSFDKQPTA